ncbi:MAG: ABC transporter permease subunit, partial [Pseudomonadota bacterium]
MAAYILRRLALILPTLFGIMLLNFIIVQMAPGGPIERIIADLKGQSVGATAGFAGNDALIIDQASGEDGVYLHGIDGETMARLRARFGFDKPLWRRFTDMIAAYATFDFGHSFFSGRKVTDLILEKLPVTLSLGGWSLLLIYLISIPLGIRKAVRDGTAFDVATSWVIVIGYALPGFLLAILLIVLFAGGRVFDWFPLHGLVSDGWAELSPLEQVLDYFWHLTLPVLSMTLGGFATLTMLTKNSFLEEIGKSYVMT